MLKILHLSDLHLSAKTTEDVFSSLLKLQERNNTFHLITITGDIFDRGIFKLSDLDTLKSRLKSLLEPDGQLAVVSGNHELQAASLSALNEVTPININGLEDYSLLYSELTGLPHPRKLYFVRRLHFGTAAVDVIHIESILLSAGGELPYSLFISGLRDEIRRHIISHGGQTPDYTLVLNHYSIDWAAEEFRKELEMLFHNSSVNLFLCGHMHTAKYAPIADFFEFTSRGCGYDRDSFGWLTLNLDKTGFAAEFELYKDDSIFCDTEVIGLTKTQTKIP